MKSYPHPILAKEGWLYIFISTIVALFTFNLLGFWVALPFILIAIFIIQFFRDPPRVISQVENIILSPADGKVICIEKCYDAYQNIDALKISIFMNVFNVHSNRSPAEGEVISLDYFKGTFVNADFDKASSQNERNAMVLELNNGKRITVVQIAGLIARRILCYVKTGDKLLRGDRYGFIRFGSRVDVYLPLDVTLLVSIGQKVVATESVLAKFND